MENRINNRVVIAVNKRSKLLGYLRKLNSGDTKGVNIKIIHKPKGKPINIVFTRSGDKDKFLVCSRYVKNESERIVLLGTATIASLQEVGFSSVGNKESKECVAIDIFEKEYAPDFKELQDILFSIIELSTYGSASTSSTILVELKPDNKRIINYEVSMLSSNPLEIITYPAGITPALEPKKKTFCKTEIKHTYQPRENNSTVTRSEKNTQEALKRRYSGKINYTLEITIASSIVKSDLKKPLKRWRKILKAEPIEIFTDTFHKAGDILGFYIKESSYGANGAAIDNGRISRYELVAKYSLSDYVANSRDRGITTPGFTLKALNQAYAKYKNKKSENLNMSHLESLLTENPKITNQEGDKDIIGIIAETLREIESVNKANASKCSKTAATEDLFCKKAKVNIKKDNNTTRPHQVPNPVVTILASDESKDKVKEIIEEANKTKSFPYMLDYDNNCVVKISDNLFDILECRNKLEDILKIRKDIDVGIFALESPYTVFKKLFNISSLTVYHSASKNLYALIGA